jgi:hypothetical protein
VVVCHRRFGKTRYALGEIGTAGFTCPHANPQYVYVAPTYGQAERISWKYLKDMFKDYPGAVPNESKLRMTIPRHDRGDVITIYLIGAENPDTIRGMYIDGVVLDEYAQCPPSIWGEILRPALSDRLGWAIFIGTPKGRNAFYKMYLQAVTNSAEHPELGWYAFVAKASRTNIIVAEELRAARIEMSEEEYEQEFECSFNAALTGAYYGKYLADAEKDARIGDFPALPNVPVFTYWDIGVDDMTVIWFVQPDGQYYRVIDYLEANGAGLEFYAKALRERGYLYAGHTLPHDGAVHEWIGGGTRAEAFKDAVGLRPSVGRKLGLLSGIEATRIIIRQSRFNLPKCFKGIEALKNYEREWDERNGVFKERPKHNWASHGADGYRLFATHRFHLDDFGVGASRAERARGIQNITNWEIHG